ncbi:hypothetical protein SESBI_37437 [Sesbania bispinosa]|nr:hypothetical protein SESBI_37437 [Sesbania bispinosa]
METKRNGNEFIFQNTNLDTNKLKFIIIKACKEVSHACILTQVPTVKQYQQTLIGWSFPPIGWAKCNVGGTVQQRRTKAGCRVVFLDTTGRWLAGFSRNLGNCTITIVDGVLSSSTIALTYD